MSDSDTDEFPIGEWVSLVDNKEPAVLADVNLDEDRVEEVWNTAYSCELWQPGSDEPVDLLWRSEDEYLILPGSEWRDRLGGRGRGLWRVRVADGVGRRPLSPAR